MEEKAKLHVIIMYIIYKYIYVHTHNPLYIHCFTVERR